MNVTQRIGSLRAIEASHGAELLKRQFTRRFDVMDLDYMSVALNQERVLALSGSDLAEHLRAFADGVHALGNASDAARKIGVFLTALSSAPTKLENDLRGLAALAFWAARNAILSWQHDIGGSPLIAHNIEWWERPEERKRTGDSLGLKLHPTINLYSSGTLIVGPKWFLNARDIPFPDSDQAISPTMQKLAREALSDYFRQVVASETMPQSERTTFLHPSITRQINDWRGGQEPGTPLQFSSYSAGSKTPGDLVETLMDGAKNKLGSLDEWVYFPRKQSLLGPR